MELATAQEENPYGNRGSDVICPPLALDGTRDEKWRRRESNETTESRNHISLKQVTTTRTELSANSQRLKDSERHDLTSIDRLIAAWPQLPDAIRELVEAICLEPAFCEFPNEDPPLSSSEELAKIIANWPTLPGFTRRGIVKLARSQPSSDQRLESDGKDVPQCHRRP
jgi:hypothetical protein